VRQLFTLLPELTGMKKHQALILIENSRRDRMMYKPRLSGYSTEGVIRAEKLYRKWWAGSGSWQSQRLADPLEGSDLSWCEP